MIKRYIIIFLKLKKIKYLIVIKIIKVAVYCNIMLLSKINHCPRADIHGNLYSWYTLSDIRIWLMLLLWHGKIKWLMQSLIRIIDFVIIG